METKRKSHLLFLLLALLLVCTAARSDCPSTDPEFTCYTDYNRIITCVWNSARASGHANSVCTVNASKTHPKHKSDKYSHRNCTLEPVSPAQPSPMSCSMDLGKDSAFADFEKWSVAVKCSSSDQTLTIVFMPGCSVKLNAPRRPAVNFTTVTWTIENPDEEDINFFSSELQWKAEEQSWEDPSVKTVHRHTGAECAAELVADELTAQRRYEARVRAQVSVTFLTSTWSDWSPSTSWVSAVGKAKPPDVAADFWGMAVAIAATFAVVLLLVFIRTNTSSWVVNKMRGSPIPSPAMSFLQEANVQNWLNPNFPSCAFQSFMKPEDILTVEVTSSVDAVAPFKPEAALLEKAKSESSCGSANSSYSNPSYSHLCSPPPFSSLSAGTLQPCAADSPYGPVANQGASAEQKQEDGSGKGSEILLLLSKGDKYKGSVQVISEYEMVEKVQVERTRLQSLDSGVCSGEEVSQESLESDSINVTDSHDEEPLHKEEEQRETRHEADLKLFRTSGGIFGKGSIQVCSDYEQVQKLQADRPERPSLDDGVSSGDEEQPSQEDVGTATESTSFLCAPPPSFPLLNPVPSFLPLPLKVPERGNRPDLQTLLNHLREKKTLASESRSVEPSGDGYRPVRQELS